MSAKNPDEFVRQLVRCELPADDKENITEQWLRATGHRMAELRSAKKRNPNWKERQIMNRNERTKQRFADNDYSPSDKRSRRWTEKDLKKFLELQEETDAKSGARKNSDIDIAKKLKRSIPSIQGIRRRYNWGRKIAEAENLKKIDEERWLHFISTDEKILKREFEEAIGGDKKREKEITQAISRGRKTALKSKK